MALAKGCPRVQTALGLHPQIAHERIRELALFERLLPETRYVGEVGLDGSPESKPHWREQLKAFEFILSTTEKAGGRVMSIHSRRAVDDVLKVLGAFPDAGIPVLHWFSGTKRQLSQAIEMGCWFSVGPAMLLGKRGTELTSEMPRNRILTETDGPFTTIKNTPLQPAEVSVAKQKLASIWDVEREEVERQVLDNLRGLMSSIKNIG